jgi:hypothetical protein
MMIPIKKKENESIATLGQIHKTAQMPVRKLASCIAKATLVGIVMLKFGPCNHVAARK